MLGTKAFTNTVGLVSYLLWDHVAREKAAGFPHNSTGKLVLLKGIKITFSVSPPVPVHKSSPAIVDSCFKF